jgi:hypothetical protein
MSITHSAAINSVAETCSLWRAKKMCIAKFNPEGTLATFSSGTDNKSLCCNECPNHIGRYLAAAPLDMELFMFQSDKDVRSKLHANRRANRGFWSAVAIPILIVYGLIWLMSTPQAGRFTETQKFLHPIAWARHNATPPLQPVQAQSMTTHQMIEYTLYAVAKSFANKVDVNGDGLTNCIDAAVLFYQYWPGDKDDVCIEVNDNDNTDMHHAFNCVKVDGVWRAIEPQAYRSDNKYNVYYMRDVWPKRYDSNYNRDGWYLYGKYVK